MNPNAGEPSSQTGGVGVDNSSGVSDPVNPLASLENVVVAAKQEAAQQTQTPQTQFANQFGSGPATPPVADSAAAPGLIDALANLETPPPSAGDTLVPQPSTDNLVPEQTQPVVETPTQPGPKQTPAEILKQQIAASVDEFLEEVTKEKVAA